MQTKRLLEKVEKVLESWAEDPYLIATKRDLSIQIYGLTSTLWIADPMPQEDLHALSRTFCGLCRAITQQPCPCASFEEGGCRMHSGGSMAPASTAGAPQKI